MSVVMTSLDAGGGAGIGSISPGFGIAVFAAEPEPCEPVLSKLVTKPDTESAHGRCTTITITSTPAVIPIFRSWLIDGRKPRPAARGRRGTGGSSSLLLTPREYLAARARATPSTTLPRDGDTMPTVTTQGAIARSWRARATAENAQRYIAFFDARLRPELEGLAGYRGALVMTKVDDDDVAFVEISVLTFWDSMDAVQAFASPAIEVAVVEPEARALLVSFDERVRHYDIASR